MSTNGLPDTQFIKLSLCFADGSSGEIAYEGGKFNRTDDGLKYEKKNCI